MIASGSRFGRLRLSAPAGLSMTVSANAPAAAASAYTNGRTETRMGTSRGGDRFTTSGRRDAASIDRESRVARAFQDPRSLNGPLRRRGGALPRESSGESMMGDAL